MDNNIKLNPKQHQQIEHALYSMPRHIDKLAIKTFIDELVFPLYHLDFETNEDVIPFINGTHPRQKRIVQYSLHIQESIEGEVLHKEYLQTSNFF